MQATGQQEGCRVLLPRRGNELLRTIIQSTTRGLGRWDNSPNDGKSDRQVDQTWILKRRISYERPPGNVNSQD